jgi:hypothetical protein
MNISGLRFKIQGQISKINYWLPNLEGSADGRKKIGILKNSRDVVLGSAKVNGNLSV